MTADEVLSDEARHVEHLRRRLKGQMSEEMYRDDDLFLRFLRARKQNVHAAEEMLRNHINWRRVNKVDEILKDYKQYEVLKKFLTVNHIGFDEDGSPITYIEFGNLDTKGIFKCVKTSEVMRYAIHHLEKETEAMKTQSANTGKKINKWTYILNYENLSLAVATDRATLNFVINLVHMYDRNYPERLKVAFAINASFYFTLCWKIVKPFLAPATVQKIKIFGKDGWKEEIVQLVSPSVLPAFLGGERADPDGNPRCDTFICHGGVVPERYYVQRGRKSFSKLPGVKRLVVSRRSKEEVVLEVEEPGSHIEWDFDIRSRDIGFSLVYQDGGAEQKRGGGGALEVVPKQRVDTQLCSESGMVKCERPGTYILQFDNTFSWMHNKEIYYSALVSKPEEE